MKKMGTREETIVGNKVLLDSAIELLNGVNMSEMTGINSTQFADAFKLLRSVASKSDPEAVKAALYPNGISTDRVHDPIPTDYKPDFEELKYLTPEEALNVSKEYVSLEGGTGLRIHLYKPKGYHYSPDIFVLSCNRFHDSQMVQFSLTRLLDNEFASLPHSSKVRLGFLAGLLQEYFLDDFRLVGRILYLQKDDALPF